MAITWHCRLRINSIMPQRLPRPTRLSRCSTGLNVMYADAAGNIAWWAAARVPIRKIRTQNCFTMRQPGADDYNGYYAFTQNPQSVNPPNGFVYSANNQPDTVGGFIFRVIIIRATAQAALPNCWANQNLDNASESTSWLGCYFGWSGKLSKVMSDVPQARQSPSIEPVISILSQWDGRMQANDIAPSVFSNMLSQIIFCPCKMSWEKKLCAPSPVYRSWKLYSILLNNDSSVWWDNVHQVRMYKKPARIFSSRLLKNQWRSWPRRVVQTPAAGRGIKSTH